MVPESMTFINALTLPVMAKLAGTQGLRYKRHGIRKSRKKFDIKILHNRRIQLGKGHKRRRSIATPAPPSSSQEDASGYQGAPEPSTVQRIMRAPIRDRHRSQT